MCHSSQARGAKQQPALFLTANANYNFSKQRSNRLEKRTNFKTGNTQVARRAEILEAMTYFYGANISTCHDYDLISCFKW